MTVTKKTLDELTGESSVVTDVTESSSAATSYLGEYADWSAVPTTATYVDPLNGHTSPQKGDTMILTDSSDLPGTGTVAPVSGWTGMTTPSTIQNGPSCPIRSVQYVQAGGTATSSSVGNPGWMCVSPNSSCSSCSSVLFSTDLTTWTDITQGILDAANVGGSAYDGVYVQYNGYPVGDMDHFVVLQVQLGTISSGMFSGSSYALVYGSYASSTSTWTWNVYSSIPLGPMSMNTVTISGFNGAVSYALLESSGYYSGAALTSIYYSDQMSGSTTYYMVSIDPSYGPIAKELKYFNSSISTYESLESPTAWFVSPAATSNLCNYHALIYHSDSQTLTSELTDFTFNPASTYMDYKTSVGNLTGVTTTAVDRHTGKTFLVGSASSGMGLGAVMFPGVSSDWDALTLPSALTSGTSYVQTNSACAANRYYFIVNESDGSTSTFNIYATTDFTGSATPSVSQVSFTTAETIANNQYPQLIGRDFAMLSSGATAVLSTMAVIYYGSTSSAMRVCVFDPSTQAVVNDSVMTGYNSMVSMMSADAPAGLGLVNDKIKYVVVFSGSSASGSIPYRIFASVPGSYYSGRNMLYNDGTWATNNKNSWKWQYSLETSKVTLQTKLQNLTSMSSAADIVAALQSLYA